MQIQVYTLTLQWCAGDDDVRFSISFTGCTGGETGALLGGVFGLVVNDHDIAVGGLMFRDQYSL